MTWITVREAANLQDVSESAIWKAVSQNRIEYRYVIGVGRSGKQLRIALESLSETAQQRYRGETETQDQAGYLSITATQREKATFKHCRVLEYKAFKESYPKADKMRAFLEQWNEQHPESPLTERQLNHWERKYDREGFDGLIDRRGGYNKGKSAIPEDIWNVFLKLWLIENCTKVKNCYEMTQEYFEGRELPHISAFKRRLENVPEPVKTRYRDGRKAAEDKCLPYIPTDYSGMHSNQEWIADHHVFDVLVVDETGEVFRPWLSGWEDRMSRRVVGYVINKASPNADIVLDSFARACYQCGIPDSVLLDNGKDYKVYDLFNRDFTLSLCNEMNIKVTHALPYNARAKPIERLFGTLEGKYCKHLPSYIGNDPKKRAEHMNKPNAKLTDQAIPYQEFVDFVANMIVAYNNTPHSSLDGKTPCEAYEQGFTVPMRVVRDKDVLAMFLMRTSKPVKVGRNGIRVPAIGYYFDDDKLFPYQGEKVIARYNTDDVRKVYVFDASDNFICIASSVELSEHGSPVTIQTIRELQRKKKARNKFLRDYMPDVEVPTIQEHVAKIAELAEVQAKAASMPYINPVKHKHTEAIREEVKRQEEKERPLSEQKAASGMSEPEVLSALARIFEKTSGGII